jgi:hypothetical protein
MAGLAYPADAPTAEFVSATERFRVTSVRVPLRKESKRGLIALAVLCVVGVATFATFASFASSGAFRSRAKDAVAARLPPAP